MSIHPRYYWAAKQLDVQPSEHLLEIGCGTGILAGLVAKKLDTGTLTAIDRSQAMINKAETQQGDHATAGKVVFLANTAAQLADATQPFDKIYAFNVSLFWIEANTGKELDAVKKLLAPGGKVYIFHQAPFEGKVQPILDQTCELLQKHGFTIEATAVEKMEPASTSVVVARA